MQSLRNLFPRFVDSTLNSYSLVFFSNNKLFALILVIVTFFDLVAGLSGLLAVMATNLVAYLTGLNTRNISAGNYGFNSLLTGLGLGLFYQPNTEFFIVLFFASLLTLLVTIALEGVIGKYHLPYLSLPFLAGIWMVLLSSRQFEHLYLSERGIFSLNEMYALGGSNMVTLYEWVNNIDLHPSLVIYFRSLGAILFQYHLVPGLLIAIGMLIYSRTSFLLSLLGFYAAYGYYDLIGANFNELSYGYIGFNFILTAIAIGGFFLISSWHSLLWIPLLTPLISFIITSTSSVLEIYQLSIFSLPFNIIVLLFLYFLKYRERFFNKPQLVLHQLYSPEKNLYTQRNNKDRFAYDHYVPLSLPFFGEWAVSQGHRGKHTHKDQWQHAWDFEIRDENKSYHSGDGSRKEDYYCFGKPVVAAADGWITEATGYIDDNEVGEMNLVQNWGNTVIIRHAENLYTKMCHLKQGSVKVNKGDYIRKGELIGACGNSGRSPRPHLHFQVQATPHIGSKTLDYPFSHYIRHLSGTNQLVSWSSPAEDEIISNIQVDKTLEKAYHFIPGQRIRFEVNNPPAMAGKAFEWEVMTDPYNYTYIYCEASGSRAYFRNQGPMHYFTHFEGNRKSLLYAFFLANYKIMKGFYKSMAISDRFPSDQLASGPLLWLQDFISPFFLFLKSTYEMEFTKSETDLDGSTLFLNSAVRLSAGSYVIREMHFGIVIAGNRFQGFNIRQKDKNIETGEIQTKEIND
ncbi:MAG TPA: urea transporter [Bacteroidales bacterium]|nr:urea transporter [Bacteroidales bacterium]HSA42169.1 urea transporter [Bacteroidales bacterium]